MAQLKSGSTSGGQLIATQDWVTSTLIDSAPTALNTLNELAAALGDDPNFATTITTALAGKAASSHTHTIANITGLQSALDGKQAAGSYLTSLGFSYSTGVTANHVVQRDANGYIYGNHINLSSSESENGTVNSFFISNGDGWTRKATVAHVKSTLGLGSAAYTASTAYATAAQGAKADTALQSLPGHTHTIANVTGLQTALDGKQAAGSYLTSLPAHSLSSHSNDGTYNIFDSWLRENGDNNNFRIYGNSRQVIFRTDGTGGGEGHTGYPFKWTYGGDGSGNSVMLLHTDGRLWTPRYGWFDTAFAAASHNHDGTYAAASHTHTIANVTGLQSALDGKQAAGSYAAASHTHAYVPTNGSTWSPHPSSVREGAWNTFYTDSGYISLGPANGSWAHIYSDKNFYFNQDIYVNNAKLATESYVTSRGYITASGSVAYATSAGSADSIDGWAFANTGSNAAKNADTIDSNGITYYTGGVTNFSGNATDGALYSQRYSSAWQHQIAGDYRSGQIALRGKNNGTWQSWRTVWDSGNLNPIVSATVSNDTTTYTKADGSTFALTTSDANTNKYLNGASFNTSDGVLTLTVASGTTITVDLDGRYLESLPAHTHDDRYYTEAESDSRFATAAQGAKADSALQSLPSHTHDDRYYTETEVNNLLAGKLGSSSKAADSELIDGIDSSRIIYGEGGFGSTSYSDMNNTAQKSGFFFYNNPTGSPFGDWTHWINSMGNSWNPNYGFQLAHAFHSDRLAVRVVANGGFSSWRDIIDSGNIGSQSVNYASSAGNADTTDGLHVHSGRNNEANKIVRTDGNGYIQAGWINTTSGNTTSTITDFYVNTNDGYIRKATKAHVQSQLGLGSAAYTASTAYATAAQGAKADTALQSLPAHNHDGVYAPVSHTHSQYLTALPGHDHSISEVRDLQAALDAKQAAGSYASSSHTHTPSQVGLGNVSNAAQVTTSYNSSLNSDSRNSRGVTRLYRRDSDSDYSVQTYWTGARWRLYGYVGDSNHADTHVGYADSAGSASSASSASSATNVDNGNTYTTGNNLYIKNSGVNNYRVHHNGSNGVFDVYNRFSIRDIGTIWSAAQFESGSWMSYAWFDIDPWGDNWGVGSRPTSWKTVNRGSFLTFGFEDWSDRRSKSAIIEIDNAIDKVKSIGGYTYWKIGSEVREAGVIAQDVLEVFPEAIGGTEEGYSVKPAALIGLLSKAIKEQQDLIESLTARIEALENK
jgi:hypothetical protein